MSENSEFEELEILRYEALRQQALHNHSNAIDLLQRILREERKRENVESLTYLRLGLSNLVLQNNDLGLRNIIRAAQIDYHKDFPLRLSSIGYRHLISWYGANPTALEHTIANEHLDFQDYTLGDLIGTFAPALNFDSGLTQRIRTLQEKVLTFEYDEATKILSNIEENYHNLESNTTEFCFYGQILLMKSKSVYAMADTNEDVSESLDLLFMSLFEESVLAQESYSILQTKPAHVLKHQFKADDIFVSGLNRIIQQMDSLQSDPFSDREKQYTSILNRKDVQDGYRPKIAHAIGDLSKHQGEVINLARDSRPRKIENQINKIIKENEQFVEKALLKERVVNHSIANQFIVLRKWNSITPRCIEVKKVTRKRTYTISSLGGGYFLIWNGKGVVVDPGYDFLKNLYDAGYSVNDIDLVIVTHAHDDHSAEIEAIYSIDYKIGKILKQKKDDGTFQNQERELFDYRKRRDGKSIPLISSEGVQIKYSALARNIDKPSMSIAADMISRRQSGYELMKQTLDQLDIDVKWFTTKHNENPWMLNNTGVGIIIELGNPIKFRIGITSDTRNFSSLPYELNNLHLLVAHLGTYMNLNSDHLGVEGASRVLGVCRPELALITEFGQEMNGLRERITKQIIGGMVQITENPIDPSKPLPTVIPGDLQFSVIFSHPLHVRWHGQIQPVLPRLVKFHDDRRSSKLRYAI